MLSAILFRTAAPLRLDSSSRRSYRELRASFPICLFPQVPLEGLLRWLVSKRTRFNSTRPRTLALTDVWSTARLTKAKRPKCLGRAEPLTKAIGACRETAFRLLPPFLKTSGVTVLHLPVLRRLSSRAVETLHGFIFFCNYFFFQSLE